MTKIFPLLILGFILIPISAMESEKMGKSNADETTPLVPRELVMDDHQVYDVFYDGSRRYDDANSQVKVRNICIKSSVYAGAQGAIGAGLAVGALGTILGGSVSACFGLSKGILFCKCGGGLLGEFGLICGGGGATLSGPYFGSMQACNNAGDMQDTVEKMDAHGITVSDALIQAATAHRTILCDHAELRMHIACALKAKVGFPSNWRNNYCCSKISLCSTNRMTKEIDQRLNKKPFIIFALADRLKNRGLPSVLSNIYLVKLIFQSSIRLLKFLRKSS